MRRVHRPAKGHRPIDSPALSPATVASLIEDAGYLTTIVDDEDFYGIRFRVEGIGHVFELFREDSTYGRVVVRYALPEGVDPDRALDVANTSNRLLKAAKTVVYDGASVAFSVESFVSDTVELGRHFERSLSALRKAIGIFFERLETTAAAEPAPSEGEAT